MGAINTALGFAVFALLVSFSPSNLVTVAFAYLAHIIVAPVAFLLHRRFVFASDRTWLSSFLRFQLGYALPLVLNGPLLFLGIEHLRGDPLVVQGLLTLTFVITNFLFNKYFAFGSRSS